MKHARRHGLYVDQTRAILNLLDPQPRLSARLGAGRTHTDVDIDAGANADADSDSGLTRVLCCVVLCYASRCPRSPRAAHSCSLCGSGSRRNRRCCARHEACFKRPALAAAAAAAWDQVLIETEAALPPLPPALHDQHTARPSSSAMRSIRTAGSPRGGACGKQRRPSKDLRNSHCDCR